MKTTHPKIRPDTAPLLDLSPHRRREEYDDEDSWLRVIGGALLLTALALIDIVLAMAL